MWHPDPPPSRLLDRLMTKLKHLLRWVGDDGDWRNTMERFAIGVIWGLVIFLVVATIIESLSHSP